MSKLFCSVAPIALLLGACWGFSAFSSVAWELVIMIVALMAISQFIINKKSPRKFYTNIIFQIWLIIPTLGRCIEFISHGPENQIALIVFRFAVPLYVFWVVSVRSEKVLA